MIPFRERLTCSVKEAAEATGLSRSYIYELIRDGRIHTTKFGYSRLVSVQSLIELVNPSPQTGPQQTRGFEGISVDGDGHSKRHPIEIPS